MEESATSDNDTTLEDGLTPESQSSDNGSNEPLESMLSCLLKKSSSNLNVQDQNGSTPLHYAARKGNHVFVQEIIGYNKVDINVS